MKKKTEKLHKIKKLQTVRGDMKVQISIFLAQKRQTSTPNEYHPPIINQRRSQSQSHKHTTTNLKVIRKAKKVQIKTHIG